MSFYDYQNRMKEKYMIEKANDPTACISNSDAIIDLKDAYNKISTLHLGDRENEICDILEEGTKEFFDKLDKFYGNQGNGKQERNIIFYWKPRANSYY